MNSSLFSALKVERNVMFIILSLIIIVAAFNIISGLTILVKNKTRDIAILKSIGVLNKSIIKIFFLVGDYNWNFGNHFWHYIRCHIFFVHRKF
jgi:lipoprotein-releasing system permease protein